MCQKTLLIVKFNNETKYVSLFFFMVKSVLKRYKKYLEEWSYIYVCLTIKLDVL